MSTLEFTIRGKPIAKARPKFFRRGKYVGTYNPQQTEEGRWLWEVKQQIGDHVLISGIPIAITCLFRFELPKSAKKKDRETVERGIPLAMIKKPDTDNCLKFVKDCLNGIVWKDDSQVTQISALKLYAKEAGTFVRIRW